MHKKWLIIILLIASVAVHFAFFGQPNQVVFDEVHFGKFSSAYYTGQYYFDIHPPLGKLLVAGFGKLFGFNPEYSFANIGQTFPDKSYLALRFLPALAGVFLPLIIFLLAIRLGIRPLLAFFAGMLIVLDNALLTQSRYILLDMFLLSFGFAALLFYFKYRDNNSTRNLLWMGIFAGLAASIKWTGIAFLGLVGIIELIYLFRNNPIRYSLFTNRFIYFVIIPFVVYFSVFTLHFSLLPKSGEGDAFMTPEFQASLSGATYSPLVKPLNTFEKFIELNKRMYTANRDLKATHPYSSQWYTWPLMGRTIYYWNAPDDSGRPTSIQNPPSERRIYLIGNPLVWWGSTVAVILLLLQSFQFSNFNFQKRIFKIDRIPAILLSGYIINMLPFVGIGRVMFLYHYFPALIFAILAFAYVLDKLKNPRNAVIVLLSTAAILFIFFSPLSFGLPLDGPAFSNRMWLNSWR